jgi:hypothetical protein
MESLLKISASIGSELVPGAYAVPARSDRAGDTKEGAEWRVTGV